MSKSMKMDWSSVIQQYPASQEYTYLNTASCGLISKGTATQAQQYYQELLHHGGQERSGWYTSIVKLKEQLAQFIHAANDEIALIPSFSVGMNFMVQMLRPLDRVLLLDQDYPSLNLPWLLHEYKVFYQPLEKDASISLEKMATRIKKEMIKIVAISHVQYTSGYRLNVQKLGQICHENDALLLVDATQSLGVIPIDVKAMQADILIASGYKWMTAGFGNGMLYMQKELLKRLQQPVIGNNSLDGFPAFKSSEEIAFNMRSFEVGHFAYANFLNMANALKEIQQIGIAQINERVQSLLSYLYEQLGDKILLSFAPENRSGIVLLKGNSIEQEELLKHKIATTARGKGLRVGVHFYNQKEDIDKLAEALKNLANGAA